MRLFIATPISSEAEKELSRIIGKLKDSGAAVKWVAPSNIHLTLKFLGDTDEKLLPELKQIIDEVAGNHKQIKSGLGELGAFPNLNRPRVYWVGLKSGAKELAAIATELENEVHHFGFPKENRPFKSHLTLGRVKAPNGLQKLNELLNSEKVSPLELTFDRIILFKSTLTPRGPVYEVMHEARLN